jgi:hypothetical protein
MHGQIFVLSSRFISRYRPPTWVSILPSVVPYDPCSRPPVFLSYFMMQTCLSGGPPSQLDLTLHVVRSVWKHLWTFSSIPSGSGSPGHQIRCDSCSMTPRLAMQSATKFSFLLICSGMMAAREVTMPPSSERPWLSLQL